MYIYFRFVSKCVFFLRHRYAYVDFLSINEQCKTSKKTINSQRKKSKFKVVSVGTLIIQKTILLIFLWATMHAATAGKDPLNNFVEHSRFLAPCLLKKCKKCAIFFYEMTWLFSDTPLPHCHFLSLNHWIGLQQFRY